MAFFFTSSVATDEYLLNIQKCQHKKEDEYEYEERVEEVLLREKKKKKTTTTKKTKQM